MLPLLIRVLFKETDMKKALLFGVSLLLLAGGARAQLKPEKPFEFDLYGIKVEPRITALIEKIPQPEKNQLTLDPDASWKSTIVLSSHWREGGAEFNAGFRLNRRHLIHFEMRY
jgi:hypothetical protein